MGTPLLVTKRTRPRRTATTSTGVAASRAHQALPRSTPDRRRARAWWASSSPAGAVGGRCYPAHRAVRRCADRGRCAPARGRLAGGLLGGDAGRGCELVSASSSPPALRLSSVLTELTHGARSPDSSACRASRSRPMSRAHDAAQVGAAGGAVRRVGLLQASVAALWAATAASSSGLVPGLVVLAQGVGGADGGLPPVEQLEACAHLGHALEWAGRHVHGVDLLFVGGVLQVVLVPVGAASRDAHGADRGSGASRRCRCAWRWSCQRRGRRAAARPAACRPGRSAA